MQWIIRRLHTVISTKESGRILRGEISQPVHVREPNRNYTVFKVTGGNTISFCIMHYAFGIALRCHYHCYYIIHCEMPVHNSPGGRILSFSRSFCPYKYRRSIHSGGICQSFECLSPTDQRCRLRLHGPSGLCSGPRGRTPCPPCRPSSGSLRG